MNKIAVEILDYSIQALRLLFFLALASFLINYALAGNLPVNCHNGTYADFVKFYTLGEIFRLEGGESVYDRTVQAQHFSSLIAPLLRTDGLHIPHPPHLVLLFSLFTYLPLAKAYVCWCLGSLAFSLASLFALYKVVHSSLRANQMLLIISAFATQAVFDSIRMGQTTLLIVSGLSIFFACLFSNRKFCQAIGPLLITIKPQYSSIWLIALISQRKWKWILISACAILLVAVLIPIFFGANIYANYLQYLLSGEFASIDFKPCIMISVASQLFLLTQNETLSIKLSYPIFLLLLCVLTFVSLKTKATQLLNTRFMSLLCTSQLILNPHALWYEAALILVPMVLLLDHWRVSAIFSKAVKEKCFSIILLYFYPLLSWLPIAYQLHFNTHLSPKDTLSSCCTFSFWYFAALSVLLAFECFTTAKTGTASDSKD